MSEVENQEKQKQDYITTVQLLNSEKEMLKNEGYSLKSDSYRESIVKLIQFRKKVLAKFPDIEEKIGE